MVQIPAIVLFLIGVILGFIIGAVSMIIVALNYKGDTNNGRKEK